jgi:hypothetical protein
LKSGRKGMSNKEGAQYLKKGFLSITHLQRPAKAD